MAINSISQNKGGGVTSMVNVKNEMKGTEYQAELQGIHDIVSSIRGDIKNIQN